MRDVLLLNLLRTGTGAGVEGKQEELLAACEKHARLLKEAAEDITKSTKGLCAGLPATADADPESCLGEDHRGAEASLVKEAAEDITKSTKGLCAAGPWRVQWISERLGWLLLHFRVFQVVQLRQTLGNARRN